MAIRYTRKIIPDRLDEAQLEEDSSALYSLLHQGLIDHLLPEHGWQFVQTGPCAVQAKNATLSCNAQFRQDVDVLSSGERFRYIQISLSSMNHRRMEADIAEVSVTKGFEKTFGLIGAAVIGVLGFIGQALLIQRVNLLLTAGLFIIGWLGGGLVGYMLGSGLGSQVKKQKGNMSFDDEVDLGVAKADWEQYVDAMIAPIDTFCRKHESRPSQATIV
ncbi:hypothetical protein [Cerasicoccus arenae]|uniref:Uncharacterized protein n=1 Tax=Cerasicoccus arenae TaxID=424488 RepID=A0A8J3GDL7_9BACT|nr:hypothetical protein [Cerasicoccus arenae]MBK1857129.1 hypothetical protein [Cerasicoccus arenae]GHB92533.1 hypothetical protein GCM10007047_04610 [Cerasicoccus arenae]